MNGSLDKIIAGYRSTWHGKLDWWLTGKKFDVEYIYSSLRSIIFDVTMNSIDRKREFKFILLVLGVKDA